MARPAIQVEDLTKSYGPVMAVDHVNFEIQPGEIVGFLGPNGAGKSTTLRILTTYLPATTGFARVAGFDVMTESMEVRRRIGYLPESVPLYGEMRVEEYLTFRAKLKEVDRRTRLRKVEEAMERCRIREVRRRLISTLSRGYRQRVGLADTLVHDPEILILDEPTIGLDPVQIEETLNTIRGLAGSHTIIFSHHILGEVEKVCERVIIIHRGRIEWDGKLSAFARQAPILEVECRGPAEQVKAWLEGRHGVERVKQTSLADGWNRFELTASPDRDIREELARGLVEKDWPLRRLDQRRQKLEDLFMKVVFHGPSAKAS